VLAESNIDAARFNEFAFASRKIPEYMHPRLRECQSCEIVYGDPVLSLDCLNSGYSEAAFDTSREAEFASRTYRRLVERVANYLPDRDGALDVGTGDGAFLVKLLELGFSRVRGVEPSAAPVAAALPHIRALIENTVFDPSRYEPGSFALITCFQVMEHVWDPLGICRGALGLLKPGGALMAVVHNRSALSAKLLGRKSPIFDIEHLQLFSPQSSRRLFEAAGFVQVDVRPIWNQYPLNYWLRLTPLPSSFKRGLASPKKFRRLLRVPIGAPAGNLVVVGFKARNSEIKSAR
jgi:SAM-dependent methyltransferase